MRSKEFSCSIPDVSFSSEGRAHVVMTIDGETVYDEWLFSVGGVITLRDLSDLVTPYARERQTVTLAITATGESGTSLLNESTEVTYCQADFCDEPAATFHQNHFLSILMGTKVTAIGRLEYLHMQGSESATCTAEYSDGSTATFPVSVIQAGAHYKTLDVSPGNFTSAGKVLTGYSITAGNRRQEYELDLREPDCAPIVVFVNSFGLDEVAYCTGTHKVDPSYKRNTVYIGRKLKNYRIDETRAFKADTGPLTVPMANWWDEVFRLRPIRHFFCLPSCSNGGKCLPLQARNITTDTASWHTTATSSKRN